MDEDPLAGVRPWIRDITPYVPGRPAGDRAGSLASNESAFGSSPRVRDAVLATIERLNRYPDPLAGELRRALGEELAVDPVCILVANGSDELIFLLALAFAAGGTVVCADPPYRLDELFSQAVGAGALRVPLVDHRHDLEAMASVEADLAFICNPHNPTGTVVTPAAIEDFLQRRKAKVVVVDEAYVDFTDDPEQASVVRHAPSGRVIVLRTFSKLFGLAGARIGYMVAAREIVEVLQRIRPPMSVNSFAQAAALAALSDIDFRNGSRARTIQGRGRLTTLFEHAGFQVVPSQANFVLVLVDDEAAICAQLQAEGISVRPGSNLGIPGAIRVSVPSQEGFDLLERALHPA